MASPSSPEIQRSARSAAVGGLLLLLAMLASWPDGGRSLMFLIFVVAVCVVACAELTRALSRNGLKVHVIATSVLAGIVPIFVFLRDRGGSLGEGALIIVTALSLIVLATVHVIGGMKNDSARTFAASVTCVLYLGALPSYAILIRHIDHGHRLLLALALVVSAYRIGSWAGRRAGRSALIVPGFPASPTWIGSLAGAAGAFIGAIACSAFLNDAFTLGRLAALGLVMGFACMIGELAGALIDSDLEIGRERRVRAKGLVSRMDTLLVATPSLYYWYRLFLT